jgi:N-methylhydantoinase B
MLNGKIDPVTFEVLSHRLHQITREMGIALERTGGTVTTTQQHDYNASLYQADGDIIAAGETYGHHVVCAGFAVKRILVAFGKEEIFPDDIFLLNDPYIAAIHNPDVYIIAPIHYQSALVGWSATFVHVSDVGAITPGGDSPEATEIFQEGFRIPGVKLVERGKLRKDVFDSITHMTRQPDAVALDLKCEIAANNVGKARLQAMYRQYGPELMNSVSAEIIRYTETVLRRFQTASGARSSRSRPTVRADWRWRCANRTIA